MAKGGSTPNISKGKSSKSPSADANNAQNTTSSSLSISKDLQQTCLNIFQGACRPSPDDRTILQEVKGHLYNRDFAAAFGKDDYLRVYASRWSPSRSLAYLDIFKNLTEHILPKEPTVQHDDTETGHNIVCLGGGAGGELVALAGWLNRKMQQSSFSKFHRLEITLVDIADWNRVIDTLRSRITNPPELSKYASQAKKDASRALLEPESVSINFEQADVLNSDQNSNIPRLLAQADVVTFMFTLNELYSTSMSKTQHLLSKTMDLMPSGSHVLVVDSPGSYSTVSINGTEKKYPMQWLLNYTLLGNPRRGEDGSEAKWEQVLSEESRWFRLPAGLQYPIDLENMRYQIHLYRRQSDSGD